MSTPHVCTMPELTCTNSRSLATRKGIVLPCWVPFPISPRGLASQQYANPEASAPHVVNEPTLTHASAGALGTSCGDIWVRENSSPPLRSVQIAPQQYTTPV